MGVLAKPWISFLLGYCFTVSVPFSSLRKFQPKLRVNLNDVVEGQSALTRPGGQWGEGDLGGIGGYSCKG